MKWSYRSPSATHPPSSCWPLTFKWLDILSTQVQSLLNLACFFSVYVLRSISSHIPLKYRFLDDCYVGFRHVYLSLTYETIIATIESRTSEDFQQLSATIFCIFVPRNPQNFYSCGGNVLDVLYVSTEFSWHSNYSSGLVTIYLHKVVRNYDRGEPAVSHKWTNWVWEVSSWSSRNWSF